VHNLLISHKRAVVGVDVVDEMLGNISTKFKIAERTKQFKKVDL
jgi:hypothetical protein